MMSEHYLEYGILILILLLVHWLTFVSSVPVIDYHLFMSLKKSFLG